MSSRIVLYYDNGSRSENIEIIVSSSILVLMKKHSFCYESPALDLDEVSKIINQN